MTQRIKVWILASCMLLAQPLWAAGPGGGAPKPSTPTKPPAPAPKPGVPGTPPPSGPKTPGTTPPSGPGGPRAPLPPQTPGRPGVPPQTPGKPGVPVDPRAPLPASPKPLPTSPLPATPKPNEEACVARPTVTGDPDTGCRNSSEGAPCGPMTLSCECYTRNTSRKCVYNGGSRQSPGICKTSQGVRLCEAAGNQTWLQEATNFCASQTCGPIIR